MHLNKWNIRKYSLLSFTIFSDLEEIKFENFNISENNIISVQLAKVLGYLVCVCVLFHPQGGLQCAAVLGGYKVW